MLPEWEAGETPSSYLRHITWNSARARFRPLSGQAQAQIQKELAMIEKLDLAGYFLIVWDSAQSVDETVAMVNGMMSDPALGRLMEEAGVLEKPDFWVA